MAALAAPGSVLFDLVVKATALLACATILVRLMRRASAASRHLVWTAALGAVLLLPCAQIALPAIRVAVLPAKPGGGTAGINAAAVSSTITVHTGLRPRGESGAITSARLPAPAPIPSRWPGAVVAVWFAGAVTLLLRVAAGTVGVRRVAAHARNADDPRLISRLQHAARSLHVRRPIVALVSAHDCIPVTWGTTRPTILLPSSAATWSDQRLDAVLVHEMGHVARFDALSHLVVRLCVALLWFNPLAWFASRQARLEGERACDDLVLGSGARASGYAEHLVALMRTLTSAGVPSSAAVGIARRSLVERRIAAILDAASNRGRASGASVALAVVLILATLPVAAAHLATRPAAVANAPAARAVRGAVPAQPTPEAVSAPEPKPLDAAVVRENQRPKAVIEAKRTPAAQAGGPAYRDGQADAAPVDFSGTWTPSDPEELEALFAVGMSRFPGSGLTIAQDAGTITITRAFRAFRHDRQVTTIYTLDGAVSSNTGLLADDYQEGGSATWNGADLVITTTRPGSETQHVLSMRGADLQIVETWSAANGNGGRRVLLFHKRQAP